MPFSKIISIDQGSREHYHVPKYQREYTWGKSDWERLTQDIDENDSGYFMGSIICVKDGDAEAPGQELIYEVVDGQQRLTTLSLLMMAIHCKLAALKSTRDFDDEEDRQEFDSTMASLRNKLVKKKRIETGRSNTGEIGGWIESSKLCFLRVQPSSQNSNLDDYLYLLGDLGLIQKPSKPRYHGVRAICKAYRFFLDNIPDTAEELLDLVAKINQLNFVHISVNSQADAFTLFETLNNRGVPLSAVDIIKNKMLAEMERQHQVNIDDSYDKWQEIIAAIPEAADQERFLRHFYNAFRWDEAIRVEGISRAIKSKLINIYEQLIKSNPKRVFERLSSLSKVYGGLIAPEESEHSSEVQAQLLDLARINAAPAYQILLYLYSLPDQQIAEPGLRLRALDLVRRYYVRRNVTDYPPTRDLDQAHMELVESCQKEVLASGALSFEFFRDRLLARGKVADDEGFASALSDSLYSTNSTMTRYLLVKLDVNYHTREYQPDLWARNERGVYVWTVEHVLPQSDNLTTEWREMIAPGDPAKASELHERNVHRLGNLTLSGFNSQLAKASFQKKQALSEDRQFLGHKIDIGYRNGLALNRMPFSVDGDETCLADAPRWTATMIEARTKKMVEQILAMYSLGG